MKCENCGQELIDGAAFCPSCGVAAEGNAQTQVGAAVKESENKMDTLGISKKMQAIVELVLSGGILNAKEIGVLRRKAEEFGDDPDVVEMVAKVLAAEELEPETITVAVRKNTFTYFLGAMKKYCVFKGRACRAEFWHFTLFTQILLWTPLMLIGFFPDSEVILFLSVSPLLIIPLVTFLPYLSLCIRRMHDTDKSGWFSLVPIYGIILLFKSGTAGPNRFGDDPKKLITKEVIVKGKKARARVEAAEKRVGIMSKIQIAGGTLIASGGIGDFFITRGILDLEAIRATVTFVWIGGIVILVAAKALVFFNSISKN